MKDFFIKLIINIIALFLVIHMVAGVSVDSWQAVIVAALVLGFLNSFLRPLLLLLTLPLNVFSLGIFTLFINGFLFYAASKCVKGFTVISFANAFWAAIVFSVISFILNLFIGPRVRMTFDARTTGSSATNISTPQDDFIDVDAEVEDVQVNKTKHIR